jgi:hypothetical protein
MSRTQARTRKGGKRVPTPYTPRPVSKYFRFDWNFAFQIARAPYIKWVSRIVFSTPFIAPFLPVLQLDRPQVRLLWLASTLYLLGLLILWFGAPPIIREYRHYKAYKAFGHSHRWIVWYLNNHLRVFQDPCQVMAETVDKGLSMPVQTADIGRRTYGVTPITAPPSNTAFQTFPPINLNNDIYLVFYLNNRRLVLPMQESDPALDNREKELFWIIFTDCASARRKARIAFWICAYSALILLVIAAVLLVIAMFTAPTELELEV